MLTRMAKLQARPLDLKAPVFDEAALARANDALKAMSGSFQEWLEEEMSKLQTARLAAEAAGWSAPTLEPVMNCFTNSFVVCCISSGVPIWTILPS